MDDEYDIQADLANLCKQFLDYITQLYYSGKIDIEEFNVLAKEKIKFLGRI